MERLNGAGREKSGTGIEQNVFGEVFDVGHMSEVVHRAPEELGLARELPPDPKPAISIRPDFIDRRSMQDAFREKKRDAPKRPKPPIALSREAAPAAEPVVECEEIAAAQGRIEEKEEMSKHEAVRRGRIPQDIRDAISQESADLTNASVSRKYGVSEPTVSKIRNGGAAPAAIGHTRSGGASLFLQLLPIFA